MIPGKLNHGHKINHIFFCCYKQEKIQKWKQISTFDNLENSQGTKELNAAKGMKKGKIALTDSFKEARYSNLRQMTQRH